MKWRNAGKEVVSSPTPWCSSYQKGSLRVTLDYSRQLYLYETGSKETAIMRWVNINLF